jgi:hypothetical protein
MESASHRIRMTSFFKLGRATVPCVCALIMTSILHAQSTVKTDAPLMREATQAAGTFTDGLRPSPITLNNSNDKHHTGSRQVTAPRKSPLKDESRGLSAFLGIGIGINVIMALVFAWWFSREWRKSGKLDKTVNED